MCERVVRERGRAVVHEYVQCTGGEMMQYHGASYIVDMMALHFRKVYVYPNNLSAFGQ